MKLYEITRGEQTLNFTDLILARVADPASQKRFLSFGARLLKDGWSWADPPPPKSGAWTGGTNFFSRGEHRIVLMLNTEKARLVGRLKTADYDLSKLSRMDINTCFEKLDPAWTDH
jgi:hypothetical protein